MPYRWNEPKNHVIAKGASQSYDHARTLKFICMVQKNACIYVIVSTRVCVYAWIWMYARMDADSCVHFISFCFRWHGLVFESQPASKYAAAYIKNTLFLWLFSIIIFWNFVALVIQNGFKWLKVKRECVNLNVKEKLEIIDRLENVFTAHVCKIYSVKKNHRQIQKKQNNQ